MARRGKPAPPAPGNPSRGIAPAGVPMVPTKLAPKAEELHAKRGSAPFHGVPVSPTKYQNLKDRATRSRQPPPKAPPQDEDQNC